MKNYVASVQLKSSHPHFLPKSQTHPTDTLNKNYGFSKANLRGGLSINNTTPSIRSIPFTVVLNRNGNHPQKKSPQLITTGGLFLCQPLNMS
ncbi:hypothetical protein BGP_1265 [Beggiatoa sp. PS]|nr:hypothetical protein BGP_1265 [Beggiatoa sp. PS]